MRMKKTIEEADGGWLSPPDTLRLAESDIHVWRVDLEQEEQAMQRLWSVLAADERSQAERFRFPADRAHAIVARGALRFILSRYLLIEPQHIHLGYGPFGKPELDPSRHAHVLHFNLSHARDLALFAVACGRQVGVDIEYLRMDFPCQEVAARFFSPLENTALRGVPPEVQHLAFFNCWTRKEAFIKALGEGLSHPLERFAVSLRPGEPAALLQSEVPGEVARWSLRELLPGPSYVAALAAEGRDWRVRCWQWNWSQGG
jgi:4'-phosphopantetheinyl transferase